jgi:hypothetical protein
MKIPKLLAVLVLSGMVSLQAFAEPRVVCGQGKNPLEAAINLSDTISSHFPDYAASQLVFAGTETTEGEISIACVTLNKTLK